MHNRQTNHPDQDWLQIVKRHVEPLHYGSVSIVIQDSRIIQIDKTERWRLPQPSPAPSAEASRPNRVIAA
jgi:hypothetical protein